MFHSAIKVLLLPLISIAAIPMDCQHCIDYYGMCRSSGELWTDDETWNYKCQNNKTEIIGCTATDLGKHQIFPVNSNVTVNGFWFSCILTENKVKYESEPRCVIDEQLQVHVEETFESGSFRKICKLAGIWILGCLYEDVETGKTKFLSVGETAHMGIIQHNCKEVASDPGVIRYWTSLKSGVSIASPSNRGENANLPKNVSNVLATKPRSWALDNSDFFIENTKVYNTKIRFLNFT